MTHRERWLSTVCDLRTDGLPVRLGESIAGAPRQPGAFRTVMALLSMYADNATGANARPSLRLLQSISHYKYATVHGALGIAQKAGYITATGTWTPPKGGDPIIVWALGYPTPDGFQPWCMGQSVTPLDGTTDGEPVSPLDGTTDGDSTGRNHRQESVTPLDGTTDSDAAHGVGDSTGRNVGDSVGRNVGESTGRSTTSSTSRPQGSEGEEEEALRAPTPDGSARTRLTVAQVRDVIEATVPAVARNGIDASNTDLADAISEAFQAGWDRPTLVAALADMKAAKKSPTGQAIARFRELARKDPAAIILASPTTAEKPAPTPQGDPLAEELHESAVDKFCKPLKWEPDEFQALMQRFEAGGLSVVYALNGMTPSVFIDHPDQDGWFVTVESTPRKTAVEATFGDKDDVKHRTFDGTANYLRQRLPSGLVIKDQDGEIDVGVPRMSLRSLERFVADTRQLAATIWTSTTTPAKPTPTPPAAATVLADDTRDPGPNGFGTVSTPSTVRPAGHDQAVREADDAERQRQQEALGADMTIEEAIALLQSRGIDPTPKESA